MDVEYNSPYKERESRKGRGQSRISRKKKRKSGKRIDVCVCVQWWWQCQKKGFVGHAGYGGAEWLTRSWKETAIPCPLQVLGWSEFAWTVIKTKKFKTNMEYSSLYNKKSKEQQGDKRERQKKNCVQWRWQSQKRGTGHAGFWGAEWIVIWGAEWLWYGERNEWDTVLTPICISTTTHPSATLNILTKMRPIVLKFCKYARADILMMIVHFF